MFIRPVFCLLVSAVLLTTALSSVSSAQWLRSGLKGQRRPLRVLGHGYSAGYHWRNPGPDSDYYNPYSAHNSLLTSANEVNDFYQYNGQPRYSPTGEPNYETIPGVPIEPDQAVPNGQGQPAVGSEANGYDAAIYRRKFAPFRSSTKSRSDDFVPASHRNQKQPNQNSDWSTDWSTQDPFAHPSDL